MDKCVVLCSGGVNSAVAVALAKVDSEPCLLHVRLARGSAERDAQCFTQIADQVGATERLVIDLPYLTTLARSDADADSKSIPPPQGWISGLLSAAGSWASYIGARRIMLGVCAKPAFATGPDANRPAGSPAQVPDCFREQTFLWNQLLNIETIGEATRLETPLIDLSKAEIIRLGKKLSVKFDQTWSCTASGDAPCAACTGCISRAAGFLEAAIADPLSNANTAVAST